MKNLSLLAMAFVVVLTSCGDDDKGENAVPLGSKPGWTANSVRDLNCRPTPSDYCNCIVPMITTKYTPEEITAPTTLVANDITLMMAECKTKTNSQGSEMSAPQVKPGEPPQQGGYEAFGEGCTTGVHKYTSNAEFCAMLQSKGLNSDCALEQRKILFAESCKGTFQELP